NRIGPGKPVASCTPATPAVPGRTISGTPIDYGSTARMIGSAGKGSWKRTVHGQMNQDQNIWETMVIDLTGVDLRSIPDVPTNVFLTSLRHILDEQDDQPETYLGFMSAFGAEG